MHSCLQKTTKLIRKWKEKKKRLIKRIHSVSSNKGWSNLCVFFIYWMVVVGVLLFVQDFNLLSHYNITLRISLELRETNELLLEVLETNELLISRNSFIMVVQNQMWLWQRREKCLVHSVSRAHVHEGFKVSAKRYTNEKKVYIVNETYSNSIKEFYSNWIMKTISIISYRSNKL